MIAAAMVLALLSYTPTDPSLNTATSTVPENALGLFGAIIADAMLQAVGLASAVLVMVVAAWGLRLTRHETVSWLWLRTVAAIAAALLSATSLEMIPAPTIWPITAGLGGSAGQVLLDLGARHNGVLGMIDPQP